MYPQLRLLQLWGKHCYTDKPQLLLKQKYSWDLWALWRRTCKVQLEVKTSRLTIVNKSCFFPKFLAHNMHTSWCFPSEVTFLLFDVALSTRFLIRSTSKCIWSNSQVSLSVVNNGMPFSGWQYHINACRSHACAVLLWDCLILAVYFTRSIRAQLPVEARQPATQMEGSKCRRAASARARQRTSARSWCRNQRCEWSRCKC